jgi:hypothetical protein
LSEVKIVSFETPANIQDGKPALGGQVTGVLLTQYLSDRKFSHLRTGSSPLSASAPGNFGQGRPPLQRSQSELREPKRFILPSPSGPPDITAIDLSPEQLKRTYSYDNVWDTRTQPLPPLPRMVGVGVYRRAADATIDWEVQRLQKRNHGLHGSVANTLCHFTALCIRPEALSKYREQSLRSDSIASSKSRHSEMSDSPFEERVDPQTGTRISRGFIPSHESSAASSFKESYAQSRKESSFSMTSLSGDTYRHPINPPTRQSTRISNPEDTIALKPTDESKILVMTKTRKIAKPCRFGDSGSNRNSAVFDDSDDDSGDSEDNEDQWLDTTSQDHGIQDSCEKLTEAKPGAHTLKPVIGRPNTLRSTRPNPQPIAFRNNKLGQVKKMATKEQVLVRRPPYKRVISQRKAIKFTKQLTGNDKSSSDSVLYMLDTHKPSVVAAIEVAPDTSKVNEKVEAEDKEVDAFGCNSTAERKINDQSGVELPYSHRNRSGTVIHHSNNLPIDEEQPNSTVDC